MATRRSTRYVSDVGSSSVNRSDKHSKISPRTIAQIKFLVVVIVIGTIACGIWYSKLNESYQNVVGM